MHLIIFLKIINILIIFFILSKLSTVVAFDIFIERFTGTNILGYGAEYVDGVLQSGGNRVVSFFKDEPIVGGYVNVLRAS